MFLHPLRPSRHPLPPRIVDNGARSSSSSKGISAPGLTILSSAYRDDTLLTLLVRPTYRLLPHVSATGDSPPLYSMHLFLYKSFFQFEKFVDLIKKRERNLGGIFFYFSDTFSFFFNLSLRYLNLILTITINCSSCKGTF